MRAMILCTATLCAISTWWIGAKNLARAQQQVKMPMLQLTEQYPRPVITVSSAGAEGNKYGFEGGRVVKIGKLYHLITTEMCGDPRFVKTRIAHWTSEDRIHWKRIGTLFESTAEMSGKDVHASLWGPMPVYNEKAQEWDMFYVGYRAEPEASTYPPKLASEDTNPYLEHPDAEHRNPHIYYNSSGVILRAISRMKGPRGIGGPYKEAGVILKPGPESQPWEGIQGTDSFFPYRVGDRWYAFYGSCHCETLPVKAWQVGLATAPDLAGPWTRVAKGNPIPLDPHFVENPVVTQLEDGSYIAVFNGPVGDAFGYAISVDGVHWNHGANLVVQPKGKGYWADPVRTPLGLIKESNGTYSLFYTGILKSQDSDAFAGAYSSAVGFTTLTVAH